MHNKCKITVLVENCSLQKDLLAEHGLAFWIEYKSRKVLFDTGQTNILQHNARHLDIDLTKTEAIVLSHGHYDHTGGLEDILTIAKRPNVYIHPKGFDNKYSCSEDGLAREIGMPDFDEAAARHLAGNIIWTDKPTEIHPGIWVTGEIPRVKRFEDVGGLFCLDGNKQKPDLLPDDQALFIETTQGLVVMLGCAHAGVINTLQYIRELTGNEKIHTVLGGMHLINASKKRINKTISALRGMNIDRMGPAHCTGPFATAMLWRAFPEECFSCSVGVGLEFEIS